MKNMLSKYKRSGWFNESYRHSLARKGIKSISLKHKINYQIAPAIALRSYGAEVDKQNVKVLKKMNEIKNTKEEAYEHMLKIKNMSFSPSSMRIIKFGDGYKVIKVTPVKPKGFFKRLKGTVIEDINILKDPLAGEEWKKKGYKK